MTIDLSKNEHQKLDEDDELPAIDYKASQVDVGDNRPLIKRKTAWIVLVFGLGIIFLGGWYFKTQVLEKPLAIDVPDYLKEQLAGTEQNSEQVIADLKTKDTDQDGLTDYQEIYQFHTSIFLADTDSDGYTDSEEANSGNDPLCPTGEKCNLLQLITPNTKLADVIEEVALDGEVTFQQATISQFRKFLVDNGLSQAEVDDLTDEDLVLIITAWEEGQENNDEIDFSSLTAEQVREFLLSQSGADQTAINNLTEEELIDIRDRLTSQ